MVMQQVVKRDTILTSIQQSEKRLAEIGTLKKHIINYSKTRSTYEEYRKVGYSKKFLEAHREEITLHKAAKATFDKLGVKKFPIAQRNIASLYDAERKEEAQKRRKENQIH